MEEIVQERTRARFIGHILKNFTKTKYKFHWHENCEICRVLDKPCNFLIDGQIIEAGVGDLLFINEYTVHKFLIHEDDSNTFIIQFPWRAILNYDLSLKNLKTHITAEEIRQIPNLEETITHLMNAMLSEQQVMNEERENPFLCSTIAALYYLLVRHFPAEKKPVKKDRDEFYKIVAYIKDHYTEALTVSQLADAMYMSRGKLSALFQRYSGSGIVDYIKSLRIKRVNLLLDQGYKITSAAFECGFQSIRTFNCVYRKHMGIAPSAYVRNAANSE